MIWIWFELESDLIWIWFTLDLDMVWIGENKMSLILSIMLTWLQVNSELIWYGHCLDSIWKSFRFELDMVWVWNWNLFDYNLDLIGILFGFDLMLISIRLVFDIHLIWIWFEVDSDSFGLTGIRFKFHMDLNWMNSKKCISFKTQWKSKLFIINLNSISIRLD